MLQLASEKVLDWLGLEGFTETPARGAKPTIKSSQLHSLLRRGFELVNPSAAVWWEGTSYVD